jgi:branched-chain amino acid transport system permease protein
VLLVEQTLNGLQYGVMLFLMAAGLTLVFGIMNLINLAHGSLYMIGAYVCAATFAASHSFLAAVLAGIAAALVAGVVIEVSIFRALYHRDHLHQVLATFGLTLFFNEAVHVIWGANGLYAEVPGFLSGHVEILPGVPYPAYRLAIIVVGLAAAALLAILVGHTRVGMLIRGGASDRAMIAALGINIRLLYTIVFGLGAALAGLSGLMAGPIFNVESGMGDNVVIVAFVVIVIGGIGSVRGAFAGAVLVGLVDTLGRAFLRPTLGLVMARAAADSAGPALASMLSYMLMAAILFFRPQGLFPPRGR